MFEGSLLQFFFTHRDLSNGFIVAEILSRRYPKEFNIYCFDNGSNLEKKRDNWEQISKYLGKLKWDITPRDYEPIMYYAEGAAEDFFKKLYEFMTGRKFPDRPRPAAKAQPHWMRPTASFLTKDTELVRIIDSKEKEMKTTMQITMHKEFKKTEQKKMGIVNFLFSNC
jgi:CH-like domain in sperm protein